MRRARAVGGKPSPRAASRTRVRVFRLTCELELSTREIVPMPTPAARATSRIVGFRGTASTLLRALSCLVFAFVGNVLGSGPNFLLQSLAHACTGVCKKRVGAGSQPTLDENSENRCCTAGFLKLGLTRAVRLG